MVSAYAPVNAGQPHALVLVDALPVVDPVALATSKLGYTENITHRYRWAIGCVRPVALALNLVGDSIERGDCMK